VYAPVGLDPDTSVELLGSRFQKERRLLDAVDQVRQRYGKDALRRLNRHEGNDD